MRGRSGKGGLGGPLTRLMFDVKIEDKRAVRSFRGQTFARQLRRLIPSLTGILLENTLGAAETMQTSWGSYGALKDLHTRPLTST